MPNYKYYIGKYSDGSNQYYVAWEFPKGKWHDAGFWSKEEAEKWLAYGNDGKEVEVEYKDNVI